MKKKAVVLFFFLLISIQIRAQKEEVGDVSCKANISQNNLLLDNKKFASVEPIMLQVQNENREFGALQLGKRKSKIYLYLKILVNNTCIKNKEAIEIYLENGKIITLKNDYPINCEGDFVKALSKKDIKDIKDSKINIIRLYTFKKDYYFSLKDSEYKEIMGSLECLKNYKIKN